MAPSPPLCLLTSASTLSADGLPQRALWSSGQCLIDLAAGSIGRRRLVVARRRRRCGLRLAGAPTAPTACRVRPCPSPPCLALDSPSAPVFLPPKSSFPSSRPYPNLRLLPNALLDSACSSPPQSIIPLWALHPRFYRLTSSPLPSSCSFSRFFAAIMADIPPVAEENTSPSQEELQQTAAAGNGAAPENRGTKRRADDADDDDEEKPGRERRKIEIKFIQDKSRRHITFSKRKAGIMKKVRRVPSPLPRPPPPFSPHRMSPSSVLLGLRMLTGRVSRASRHTSCPSSPEPRCCCWSCRRPASSTPSPLPSSSRW